MSHHGSPSYRSGLSNTGSADDQSSIYGYTSGDVGEHRREDERMMRVPSGTGFRSPGSASASSPSSSNYLPAPHQYQRPQPPYAQQPQNYPSSTRFPRHLYEGESHFPPYVRYGNAPSAESSGTVYFTTSQPTSRSSTPSSSAAPGAGGSPSLTNSTTQYHDRESSGAAATAAEGGGATALSSSPNPSSVRVAKACVPCSTKKRRCDGGKPECKVCTVLGTPCSYESRGLKRGPPKGFRAGPKESARAKLLRSLETTIRDLSQHIGVDAAGMEISRISNERGIALTGMAGAELGGASVPAMGRRSSKADSSYKRRLSLSGKRMKRELSAPVGGTEDAPTGGTGGSEESDSQDEDFLGISEQGNVRHFGSSSGIQLLQQRPPNQSPHNSDGFMPPAAPLHPRARRTPSGSGDWRSFPSPIGAVKPPIALPSIPSRTHGSTGTSNSFSPQASPAQRPGEVRQVSPKMSRKLFEQYWSGFHTFWPVLYKPGFDKISIDLLPSALDRSLLNAIYSIGACVASPSLDADLEAEIGDAPAGEVFAQRAEANLFQRASPPLPTLSGTQTCFLLSLYNQGAGQLSKAYLYTSLATSMAIDLGLHRHLRHYDSDMVERESRSRLIHCIYILSTLLSAEMGRPPMLRSKDIDVPLLSEAESDEFEKDGAGRTLHPLSCLNTSRRLFAIVETVLTQVHSFRRKAVLRRHDSESTRMLVDNIHDQLVVWRTRLPSHMQMPPLDGSYDYRKGNAPLPSFAAVHVWYHTAMLLLHRPFIPHDEGSSLLEVLNDKNHSRCTFAAQELFDLLSQLSRSSDVDRLSTDLAYVIFTAAVMFVFNARLGQAPISSLEVLAANADKNGTHDLGARPVDVGAVAKMSADAKRNFLMCKVWLKGLSERWPAASAHKQLLDGFASVGEGVVTGEEAMLGGVGSRPPTSAGAPARSAPPPSNDTVENGWGPSSAQQFQVGQRPSQVSAQPGTGQTLSQVPFNASSNEMYPSFSQASGAGRTASDPSQSLGAYFNFPPNLFDMENVYWNETATRTTPYLGPMPDTNLPTQTNRSANFSSQPQQSPGATSVMPLQAATPQTQYMYANQASNATGGMRKGTITSQPTVSPASQAQHTPESGRGSTSFASPSPVFTKNRGRRSANSEYPTGNSGNDGLAMLAQQATTTTGGHTDGRASQGSASQSQLPTGGYASGGDGGGGGTMPAYFSPFSLHQEPTAPEWGDVMSMLQLPPAFTQ